MSDALERLRARTAGKRRVPPRQDEWGPQHSPEPQMPAALPVEPKRRAVGKKRQGWKQIHPYVPEEIYAALNLEIAKAKAAGDAEIDQSAVILPLLVQWLSERGVEINLDLE